MVVSGSHQKVGSVAYGAPQKGKDYKWYVFFLPIGGSSWATDPIFYGNQKQTLIWNHHLLGCPVGN